MATRAFWNNPIVVSAFRVKYRKSAPTLTATLWLLALAGLGVVMHHNLAGTTGVVPWYRLYFAVVIGVQAALAGVLALSSTHASITSEVGNRTLDFQRIASLSPFSILVGKLFGEPAIAYLLVIASIPISLACVALGAAPADALPFIYVNLFTTTLLAGALGLQHSLELTPGKASGGAGGSMGWIIFMIFGAPYLFIGAAAGAGSGTATSALISMVVPFELVRGIYYGRLWEAHADFLHWSAPQLLVTPVTQLLIAALLFFIMARKMRNPIDTPLPKAGGYALAAALGVVFSGVLLGNPFVQTTFRWEEPLLNFCLFFAVFQVMAIYYVTPSREAVQSWIWGLKGNQRGLRDWLLGERAPNLLATLIIVGLGTALAVGMIGGYAWWRSGALPFSGQEWLAEPIAAAALLVATIGVWLQVFSLSLPRLTAVI
ncbi:MAG TPA: hypothetical protein VNC50_00935, partial [Planctomycetia bacterium]|nr:hypothetical protein [Planctomycetia bacterium]